MSDNKNLKIQLLRAVAILCVIMIHTAPSGEYPNFHGIYQVLCRPILNIAVATFIFLSGYLTSLKIENVRLFYKKRIIRVLIPYIIWSILYSLVSVIAGSKNIIDIFIDLFTASATEHLYYIFVYIGLVLITPFLYKLAYSKYRFIGWMIAPVSTLIFKYGPLIFGIYIPSSILTIWNICFLGWFTYYYLGILLGNKIISINYKVSTLIVAYFISLIIQIVETYIWWKNYNLVVCGTQLKLSTFLTSTIFLLLAYKFIISKKDINYDNLFVKILVLIGDCSFGIYLSHVMVIYAISYIFPIYISIPFCINSILIIIITLLCVLIGQKICGKKVGKYLGLY